MFLSQAQTVVSGFQKPKRCTVCARTCLYIQTYVSTFPNTILMVQVAAVTPSNATPERFFSLVTWLTSRRRSETGEELLEDQITIQELGALLDKVPEEFWTKALES